MNSLINRTCSIPAFPVAMATTQTRRTNTLVPRAQVTETNDGLLIELELPGLSRDNVEVIVENDELTIVGRRPAAVASAPVEEGAEPVPAPIVILRERPEGDYRRTFVLGDRLDASAISATMANGILTITIPKGEKAKPRTIEVR